MATAQQTLGLLSVEEAAQMPLSERHQHYSLTGVLPITYSIQSRNGCNSLKIERHGSKTANYFRSFALCQLVNCSKAVTVALFKQISHNN